jgi:hypothetical protein
MDDFALQLALTVASTTPQPWRDDVPDEFADVVIDLMATFVRQNPEAGAESLYRYLHGQNIQQDGYGPDDWLALPRSRRLELELFRLVLLHADKILAEEAAREAAAAAAAQPEPPRLVPVSDTILDRGGSIMDRIDDAPVMVNLGGEHARETVEPAAEPAALGAQSSDAAADASLVAEQLAEPAPAADGAGADPAPMGADVGNDAAADASAGGAEPASADGGTTGATAEPAGDPVAPPPVAEEDAPDVPAGGEPAGDAPAEAAAGDAAPVKAKRGKA